jgi:hypothetical protein
MSMPSRHDCYSYRKDSLTSKDGLADVTARFNLVQQQNGIA